MGQKRTFNYKNTASNDGTFQPSLSATTTRRIIRYCSEMNLNKTRFVEKCVNERLDELERELLGMRTKEELIELILRNK